MSVLKALSRGLGYLLLMFSLPLFIDLSVLLNSHDISPLFLQNMSSLIQSFTKNSLLSTLLSISSLDILLLVSGLIAIGAAVLILLGSDGYDGLSNVGTELVVLSAMSLVFVYVVPTFVLPKVSSLILPAGFSGASSTIFTLLSPIIMQLLVIDAFFLVFGSFLIIFKSVLSRAKTSAPAHSTAKKVVEKKKQPYALYRKVGIPLGAVTMIVLLVLFTFYLVVPVSAPSLTPAPANSVSQMFQAAPTTLSIFNASDFLLLNTSRINNSYNGAITLETSLEPIPFSIPLTLSIEKIGDPLRVSINVNLSSISNIINSLLNAFVTSNGNCSNNCNVNNSNTVKLPTDMSFLTLYNDSGLITCTNLFQNFTQSNGLQCNYQRFSTSFNTTLLNTNNPNETAIGSMFSGFSSATSGLSGRVGSNNSRLGFPTLKFIGNEYYMGSECTLFYVNETSAYYNMTGEICLSDYTGLPSLVHISNVFSLPNDRSSSIQGLAGESFELNIDLSLISSSTNITYTGIDTLPPGARFSSS